MDDDGTIHVFVGITSTNEDNWMFFGTLKVIQ